MALQRSFDPYHALILPRPAHCFEHWCRTAGRAHRARLSQCRREGFCEGDRLVVLARHPEHIHQLYGEFPDDRSAKHDCSF